jgi:uncharacterized caspase-like protein
MRYLAVLLAIFYMFCGAEAARAGERVALVVGNGTYRKAEPLTNPPISAQAMAGFLRKTGFDVIEATDLTRDEMNERLAEFGSKAKGADLALFYYSGLGVGISGTEYLFPIDADVKSETDIKLGGAINVDVALEQAMSDAKVKLVFLDASRDNPLPAPIASQTVSRGVSANAGLAEMKSLENSLTVFATAPGGTAPDGPPGIIRPFTRALIANIATSGAEIRQAMTRVRTQIGQETNGRQMSWGHTNLLGEVYLSPPNGPTATK